MNDTTSAFLFLTLPLSPLIQPNDSCLERPPFITRVRSTWKVRVCDSKRDRYWQSESNTMSIASLKITSHNGIFSCHLNSALNTCDYTWLTWELSYHWCYPEGCQPFPPMLVILHSNGGSSNERRYATPSPAITASFQRLDGRRHFSHANRWS